jgi:hypothetical protein
MSDLCATALSLEKCLVDKVRNKHPTYTFSWNGRRGQVKKQRIIQLGFQVLTVTSMKMAVFWVVAP